MSATTKAPRSRVKAQVEAGALFPVRLTIGNRADHELIKACRDLVATDCLFRKLINADPAGELPDEEEFHERMGALMESICSTSAHTTDGIAARHIAFVSWWHTEDWARDDSWDARFAAATWRDTTNKTGRFSVIAGGEA